MKLRSFFIIGLSTLLVIAITACAKLYPPAEEAVVPEEETEAISQPSETKPVEERKPAVTPAPKPNEITAPESEVVTKPKPATQTIVMTSQGFSPSSLTIAVGTTVQFVNKDPDAPHWPASGVHPTHQICPGFDSLRPIEPEGSYRFTFTEAKTCPMHDHLNPSLRGTVVVTEP